MMLPQRVLRALGHTCTGARAGRPWGPSFLIPGWVEAGEEVKDGCSDGAKCVSCMFRLKREHFSVALICSKLIVVDCTQATI